MSLPPPIPPLVQHMEARLGLIQRGVRSGRVPGLQAVAFTGWPGGGAATWCTLGLSSHRLRTAAGADARLELVGCWHGRFEAAAPQAHLLAVAEALLAAHRAPDHGEILGPHAPLVPGAAVTAFRCARPTLLPEDFAVFAGSTPPTRFVWLVPVSAAEATWAAQHGAGAWEERLAAARPDLLDLERPSLV